MTRPRRNCAATLDSLAFEARRAWRKSNEEWLAAAAALAEARDLCKHGEWTPWLTKTGIPAKTADRMILLARCGVEIRQLTILGRTRCYEICRDSLRSSELGAVLIEGDPWKLAHPESWRTPDEVRARRYEVAGAIVAEWARFAAGDRHGVHRIA